MSLLMKILHLVHFLNDLFLNLNRMLLISYKKKSSLLACRNTIFSFQQPRHLCFFFQIVLTSVTKCHISLEIVKSELITEQCQSTLYSYFELICYKKLQVAILNHFHGNFTNISFNSFFIVGDFMQHLKTSSTQNKQQM